MGRTTNALKKLCYKITGVTPTGKTVAGCIDTLAENYTGGGAKYDVLFKVNATYNSETEAVDYTIAREGLSFNEAKLKFEAEEIIDIKATLRWADDLADYMVFTLDYETFRGEGDELDRLTNLNEIPSMGDNPLLITWGIHADGTEFITAEETE